jgi:hypothetical protein
VTGEVRTLETAFNVRWILSHIQLRCMKIVHSQNFFTIVKALVSQAQTASEPPDGRHHYDDLEVELTKTYEAVHFSHTQDHSD